jgi:hypothetical protein
MSGRVAASLLRAALPPSAAATLISRNLEGCTLSPATICFRSFELSSFLLPFIPCIRLRGHISAVAAGKCITATKSISPFLRQNGFHSPSQRCLAPHPPFQRPRYLRRLREQLKAGRSSSQLFDTLAMTRDFEVNVLLCSAGPTLRCFLG